MSEKKGRMPHVYCVNAWLRDFLDRDLHFDYPSLFSGPHLWHAAGRSVRQYFMGMHFLFYLSSQYYSTYRQYRLVCAGCGYFRTAAALWFPRIWRFFQTRFLWIMWPGAGDELRRGTVDDDR